MSISHHSEPIHAVGGVNLKKLESTLKELSIEELLLKKRLKILRKLKSKNSISNAKVSPLKKVGVSKHIKSRRKTYECEVLQRKYEDLLKYVTNLENGDKEKHGKSIHESSEIIGRVIFLEEKCEKLCNYVEKCKIKIPSLKKEVKERDLLIQKMIEGERKAIDCNNSKMLSESFVKNFEGRSQKSARIPKQMDYDSHRRRCKNGKRNGLVPNVKSVKLSEVSDKEKEKFLIEQIHETRNLYEKATIGYKDEAQNYKMECEQLREEKKRHGEELRRISSEYENKLRNFQIKIDQIQLENGRNFDNRAVNFEELLVSKNAELKLLKEERKKELREIDPNLFEKLSNILFLSKDTIKEEDFFEGVQNVVGVSIESERGKENEHFKKWKGNSVDNRNDLEEKEENSHSYIDYKQRYFDLQEKFFSFESKICSSSDDADLAKGLSSMLRSSEQRLSAAEISLKKSESEKEISDRKCDEVREQIELKTMELEEVRRVVSQLEDNVDGFKSEVSNFEFEIGRKDSLLEKMSSELERRIVENAHLTTESDRIKSETVEKRREFEEKEIEKSDKFTENQILGFERKNVALCRQLSSIRNDNERLEERCRNLSDEVERLNLKNVNYQRQIETISDMYRNMFPSQEKWSKQFAKTDGE